MKKIYICPEAYIILPETEDNVLDLIVGQSYTDEAYSKKGNTFIDDEESSDEPWKFSFE